MSATNTTTNYGLPIFIETDKPAWLVDFNGAMRAIDTQMKTNADAIATKSPILTFNDTAEIDFTKSGDIITANLASGVSDKVGRALVTPISAPAADQIVGINTNGAQENLDIGAGLTISNGVLSSEDFNLTDITTYQANQLTSSTSGITVTAGSITVALNADKTIGKVYGGLTLTSTLSSRTGTTITIPKKVAPGPLPYNIAPAGFAWRDIAQAGVGNFGSVTMRVEADGTLSLSYSAHANHTTLCAIWPCIYFFRDFGD